MVADCVRSKDKYVKHTQFTKKPISDQMELISPVTYIFSDNKKPGVKPIVSFKYTGWNIASFKQYVKVIVT